MSQTASRFGVHPTMVSNWKRQMVEGAADIFDKSNKSRKQAEAFSPNRPAEGGKLFFSTKARQLTPKQRQTMIEVKS